MGCERANHSHTAADTPESLRSCMGRLGDRDAPSENKVCTEPSHYHTAEDTPKSLWSCLGRLGDRDAPWENGDTQCPAAPTQRRMRWSPSSPACAAWGIRKPRGRRRRHNVQLLPHSGGYTRVPPVVSGPLGGERRPVGERGYTRSSHSHTAADTPESLRSCLGRLGERDALWENQVCTRTTHSHTAADRPEYLRSCLGCLGNRDAPWENENTQGPATPKHRRIPCEPLRSCHGRFGDRDAPWENELYTGPSHSHTAADTPEFLRSCLDCLGDRDAP